MKPSLPRCHQENEKLLKTIKSFKKDWKILEDHPLILKSFYEYVSLKFSIQCESEMLRIERSLSLNKFTQENSLLSSKILLYSWLEPRHLNVQGVDFLTNPILLIKDLNQKETVSEMIFKFLEVIKSIYESIKPQTDHSVFLSVLIVVILNSKSTSLEKVLYFMENFRRPSLALCEDCKGKERPFDEGEVNYYLTVLKAALKFIEKMEFYDLKITKEEFDLKMM
ncbi:Vacuolar protein sorting-associated protein 9a [Nosema bombycis CQ1]|uniref:Vacuolar protein sorting-associated protein 9a n=1 Tax=Nosema bombycis (strain CQ1 / CVCC 102059) TaxID=578461 RepID=R0KSW6_NOSB1|nr:Vacuolar protein sorting-associated protein 9a [Nosema bombycis CQ1]|eukprot:EOB13317.1 Vacuolar protein sorting-associated protein 9a [Nosema bombycis CQ1]